MGELIELIAVVLGLSIPLSIIYGIFNYQSKKLALKHFNNEERQVLLELKSENAELKRRLEQLEAASGIPEEAILRLEEADESDVITKLELLAKQRQQAKK